MDSATVASYDILTTLGEGSYGKVHGGRHKLTGEKVALKVIGRDKGVRSINREVDAMKLLSHPRLCQLYQVIETADSTVLAMEFCPGTSLQDMINDTEDGLPEETAKKIFWQIASGLQYMHQRGVSHRDIKPSNVICDEKLSVKILDMGLSATPLSGMKTLLTTFCGTTLYVPPEIVGKEPYQGWAADMWSLGVSLFYTITKSYPFLGQKKIDTYKLIINGNFTVPQSVSFSCRDVLESLLQYDPTSRLNAQELLQHPWFSGTANTTHHHDNIQVHHLDQKCLKEMAKLQKMPKSCVQEAVAKWQYDCNTATYLLLKRRRDNTDPAPTKTSFFKRICCLSGSVSQ